MEYKNIYTNEVVAQIRKHIKARCPSLKVKRGRGTAGAWIDIEGTANEFGAYTSKEQYDLFAMGLMPHRNLTTGLSISPEERKHLVEEWGIEC